MASEAGTRHASDVNLASEDPAISYAYCTPYIPYNPATSTPLEHYIHLAEEEVEIERKSTAPIFSNQLVASRLYTDRQNRILIFRGCFNPPHLGHLELLAHVFLRTDCRTIAAIIHPVGLGGCRKQNATVKGRAFSLNQNERTTLLHDEVLSRFSWVYIDELDSSSQFRKAMKRLAKADGYELAFTYLSGSDHWDLDDDTSACSGLSITSDVTRPSVLVQDGRTEPERLSGCSRWRKILPAKSVASKGNMFCWACWKFQMLCPELVGDEPANILNYPGFGGIAREILQWCHKSDGVVWWCNHSRNAEAVMWFFPSGRVYPTDERRAFISSTTIRKLLDQNPQDEVYDAIKNLSMNPKKLLRILGLNKDCHNITELAEEAETANEDSQEGKSRDDEEFKLKIKAWSQEVSRHDSTSIPEETKDDWDLGSADASNQMESKRRFTI